ncbi:MAG TPA: FAD-binding oxidoreductase [Candidatus Hydrogenedentes bacterium]|nr:FAD-binding oxidoreductase [Candidatus Hydrogenedentota bacterium]HIJ72985.1 FAD-binding oxidoreductase [Candidatus Hydrogenedentota bacterium]
MAPGEERSAAIRDWAQALGDHKVAVDDTALDRYARTTQDRGTRPCCILHPSATEDVQKTMRIASKHHVSVYPISCGKNWGYGDACAPTDGAAILDLSGMNRIVEFDANLAYAVIEPGVTQQQLYAFLQENAPGLWLDCTGAGLGASLVGNTLDRGFGHTRYGDHFLSACGMEIVLADARVLNTGFGHYADARAAHIFRYGVGPFLDGLFCQSNLGIVTKLGLWLMPKPDAFTFFFVRVDQQGGLPEIIDRLRPLRMRGILESAVHIGNDLRVISAAGRYPWDLAGGVTPLPELVRARLRKSRGLGAWNVGGALTGTRGHVRASKRALRNAVGPCGRLTFVDDKILALGEFAARRLAGIGLHGLERKLEPLKPNYGLLKGMPTDEPLLGTQWRLRRPPEGGAGDPLDFGCGVMWVSPVLPMTGEDAKRVLEITEPVFDQFGFEPLATFTLINERAIIGILNVVFDKADAEETARAVACYDALFDGLMNAGYIPYRTGPRGMPKLRREDDVFWQVAAQIKRALDPNDTIASGRYLRPQRDH